MKNFFGGLLVGVIAAYVGLNTAPKNNINSTPVTETSVMGASTQESVPTLHVTVTQAPSVAPAIVTPSITTAPIKKPTLAPTATIYIAPTKVPYVPPTSAPVQSLQTQSTYTCNCKKTCASLSCDEAQYQLNSCGCSARDGDGDGIACDSKCQ